MRAARRAGTPVATSATTTSTSAAPGIRDDVHGADTEEQAGDEARGQLCGQRADDERDAGQHQRFAEDVG